MAENIGVDEIKLPHANPSAPNFKKRFDSKAYRESYDQECIDLVAERFKQDIELFGYDF